MSYVQVDSSVRTNRKFLQAGPAASWLWLCGNAYSQDTLTDGFIPFEAVKYLGVENPKPLIPKLVKARLWDECEGGWRIHDYLDHNKSADEIRSLKRRRGDGGRLGGRPHKEPSSETLKVSADVNHTQNPSTASTSATATTSASETATAREPRPSTIIKKRRLDAAWEGGRVWVPQRTHSDFLGYRNGNEAELLAWYAEVDETFASEIDPDMFVFWRARYRERWPASAGPMKRARVADGQPKEAM